MPKQLIKRFMPDHQKIREHKHLRVFGRLLHDPNLFHLNRRSASGAFAVGLFFAWIPVPFQMLLAAGASMIVRVNLPLSVALVWITNPLTIPPMFYGAYRFGAWMMGIKALEREAELSIEWLQAQMEHIWEPLLLGSGILAVGSSLLGFITIRLLWRLHLIRHLQQRKLKRRLRQHQREREAARAAAETAKGSGEIGNHQR